jgi:hypothetical protein
VNKKIVSGVQNYLIRFGLNHPAHLGLDQLAARTLESTLMLQSFALKFLAEHQGRELFVSSVAKSKMFAICNP